jgi:hypothetical protein
MVASESTHIVYRQDGFDGVEAGEITLTPIEIHNGKEGTGLSVRLCG